MKKIYLTLLISLFSTAIHAQDHILEWAKSIGGPFTDRAHSITTDDLGNVYITGPFEDTVDFDPGAGTFYLSSIGTQDIFIQKLDASGNFIWAIALGQTTLSDVSNSITTDLSGNVYLTGHYAGTIDFDPGADTTNLTSSGGVDIFILKLDAGGDLIWARSVGGIATDIGNFITVDNSGNLYITGYYQATVDFDPGVNIVNLTSIGSAAYVLKLDPNGNFIWARDLVGGPLSWAVSESLTIAASGNLFLTGMFEGTVDFDPGAGTFNLNSNGKTDAFIQKLDTSGNYVWAKSIGGSIWDQGNSVATDSSGNVYVTGFYADVVDFDPGASTFNLTANGSSDAYVLKLNANGNFIWVKTMGGVAGEEGRSMGIDASDNIYITGHYQGTVDFDPGADTFNLTATGFGDVFIQKLTANGNFIWVKSIGGTEFTLVNSITINASGNMYLSGEYRDIVDFDPGQDTLNLTSNGVYDFFVLNFSCAPNTGTDVVTACSPIIWIDGNIYSANNDSATYTLTNEAGCDSVVTLNLTFNTVDASVTTTDPTITANATGAMYQWLDCDNGHSVIVGETAKSFTATVNGRYAVEVIENGCTDTSVCVTITKVGIKEASLFKGVSIFPNPSDGIVNIDLGNLKEVSIHVFNVSGQLIYQEENITSSTHQFELNTAAGVYTIELSAQGEKRVYKVVKE